MGRMVIPRSALKYIMITPRRLFFGIVALYLLVFGVFVWAENRTGGLDEIQGVSFPVHGPDSAGYLVIAENLAERGVFSEARMEPYAPDTFRTPGYSLFVAFFGYIMGGGVWSVVAIQIILTALTALVIWEMGKRMGYAAPGFGAALLFALEPTVIFSTLTLMSEALFMCLFLFALYVWFFADEFLTSNYRAPLAGLLVGLAILVRPIGIFLPVVFLSGKALFVSKEKVRSFGVSSLLFLATVAVVVFPWIMRNKAVSGVYGLSALSSYNLALSDVAYFLSYRDGISREDAVRRVNQEAGSLSEAEQYSLAYSSKLSEAAWSYIAADPLGYLGYHAVSSFSFFGASSVRTIANNIHSDGVREFFALDIHTPGILTLMSNGDFSVLLEVLVLQGFFTLERVAWVLLAFFALLGAYRAASSDYRMPAIFLLIILMWAFLTGPVFTPRYRIPGEPFLFILAMIGFWPLGKRFLEIWR